MKKYVKLFENFMEPEMSTGKNKQLWARIFWIDGMIYGVHPTKEAAEIAEEIVLIDTAISMGEDPDEYLMDAEGDVGTDVVLVDPNDVEQSAALIEACINTKGNDFIKSKAIQDPRSIAKKLILFGVDPFAKSEDHQGFKNMDELVEFFDGNVRWLPKRLMNRGM